VLTICFQPIKARGLEGYPCLLDSASFHIVEPGLYEDLYTKSWSLGIVVYLSPFSGNVCASNADGA